MNPSRRAIGFAVGWMLAGFAIALAVLPFVHAGWPAWVLPAVVVFFAASIIGPILWIGWMIGRVLARGGGFVGLVFAAGVLAAPVGQAIDRPWLMWPGYGALALGLAGFVLLGVRAVRRVDGRARPPRARRARGQRAVRRRGAPVPRE